MIRGTHSNKATEPSRVLWDHTSTHARPLQASSCPETFVSCPHNSHLLEKVSNAQEKALFFFHLFLIFCTTQNFLYVAFFLSCLCWVFAVGLRLLLLRSMGSLAGTQKLWHTGFIAPTAYGIFLDQRSNPCPLHWKAGPQPLNHQGSPSVQLSSVQLLSRV